MDNTRKSIFLVTANVVWMFVVSAGLAWMYTGQFDPRVALVMGAMLLPLLAVAAAVVLVVEHRAERRARQALGTRVRFGTPPVNDGVTSHQQS